MHDFEGESPDREIRIRQGSEPTAAPSVTRPASGPGGPDAASLLHLQRTAGNAGVVQMLEEDRGRSPVLDVVGRGGGTALDDSTRESMESKLGADFGGVRVHTDAAASRSAEAVGANAYTVGSDIVFRSGRFDPGSATGQRTLAHELTHVVQQRQGPVDGTDAPGGIRLSDPDDRFERAAESTAGAVMSQPSPASASAPTAQLEPDDAYGPQVQRQMPEEDEEEEAGA
jgi:Domain of unknown function (DUF4157)